MTTIKTILEQEIKKAEAEINLALTIRDKAIGDARQKYTASVQEHTTAIKAMKEMMALFDKHNKVFNAISATIPKESTNDSR